MTDRASMNRPGTDRFRMQRVGLNRRDAAPRIRAGARMEQWAETPHSWIHDEAPRLRAAGQERRRRETVWAWLSVLTLIVSWDASTRLDEHVSPPHARSAHAVDSGDSSMHPARSEMLQVADLFAAASVSR